MNKILLIEDDAEIQAGNHEYLTGRGYKYIPENGVTV